LCPEALRRVASQNKASLFAMKRHNAMPAAALRDATPRKVAHLLENSSCWQGKKKERVGFLVIYDVSMAIAIYHPL